MILFMARATVFGVALCAASVGAFGNEDPPYRPDLSTKCDAPGGIGFALGDDSDRCVTVHGRVSYQLYQSTNDPAQSYVTGTVFASAIDMTDVGPARAVVGIDQRSRFQWIDTPGAMFDFGFVDVTSISDAYVSIGNNITLTVGRRDERWGSLGRVYEEEPFWLGDLFRPALSAFASYNQWLVAPRLGGHVVQFKSQIGGGVTLAGALEDIDGSGTALGLVRYDAEQVNGFAMVAVDRVLASRSTNQSFLAGLNVDLGDTRVRAHAAGSWADGFDYPNLNAGIILQQDFGPFDVALNGGVNTQQDESYSVIVTPAGGFSIPSSITKDAPGWSIGSAVGFALSPTLRNDFGGQYSVSHGFSDSEYASVGNRLTLALSETLEVSGEIGAQRNVFSGTAYDVQYVGAKASWDPGGGIKASLEGTRYSTGGYEIATKAEKRF